MEPARAFHLPDRTPTRLGLLDLAKALYPDRIVILPDAYRSAKKFDGILTEEWEILVATATTLWDLCFKSTLRE